MVKYNYQRTFMPITPDWDIQRDPEILQGAVVSPPLRIKEWLVKFEDPAQAQLFYYGGPASLTVDTPFRKETVGLNTSRQAARDVFQAVSGRAVKMPDIAATDLQGWRMRVMYVAQKDTAPLIEGTLESAPSGPMTMFAPLDGKKLRTNYPLIVHGSPLREFTRYCAAYNGRLWMVDKEAGPRSLTTCTALLDNRHDELAPHEIPLWVGAETTHRPRPVRHLDKLHR